MKKLTQKEREIMDHYWSAGPMFVRELRDRYEDPKPHFNTLSTMVRILEKQGFLSHRQYGNTYQYYPLVSAKEYGRSSLAGIIKSFFNDSYLSAVSSFVKEEKITVEELKNLIAQIDRAQAEKEDK
ncbi:MAG: BlaI/MecI/CopY family transcriptional regulator [Prevotella sp.]|nr:BlaI/MecI/CopY family transcriptional regulator [Prevotella sp.]MDY4039150.1 BlaI/MecI/CopY family transcriptional regulator [Prevotella sp.]